jgi:hypothetical protein
VKAMNMPSRWKQRPHASSCSAWPRPSKTFAPTEHQDHRTARRWTRLWRAEMKATGLSHHHREERNTSVGEGHQPPPAPPWPPKPRPPPPAPPRCQPAVAAKHYRHHRTCLLPRLETSGRPSPYGPEPTRSSLPRLQERLHCEAAQPGPSWSKPLTTGSLQHLAVVPRAFAAGT